MVNEIPDQGQAASLVAQAVERMAAAKIAVGLPPLAILGSYGLVQSIRLGLRPVEHVVIMIGAVLSIVAMVAYGMQAVSQVLEKPSRWAGLIYAGSFVPLLFAGYVIVTRILYLVRFGGAGGIGSVAGSLALMVLAVMSAWADWKLVEVHLLAREMAGVGRMDLERGAP
jgi:hypothetical protein